MRIHYTSNSVPCHKLRIEDGLLIATRHAKPAHLLRKPLAWSYNNELIEAMKKAGVDVMEVLYEDKIYSCPFPRFLKYAKRLNRGYGEQLYLCLYLWDSKRINEPAENDEPVRERREQKVVLPSLFS